MVAQQQTNCRKWNQKSRIFKDKNYVQCDVEEIFRELFNFVSVHNHTCHTVHSHRGIRHLPLSLFIFVRAHITVIADAPNNNLLSPLYYQSFSLERKRCHTSRNEKWDARTCGKWIRGGFPCKLFQRTSTSDGWESKSYRNSLQIIGQSSKRAVQRGSECIRNGLSL